MALGANVGDVGCHAHYVSIFGSSTAHAFFLLGVGLLWGGGGERQIIVHTLPSTRNCMGQMRIPRASTISDRSRMRGVFYSVN